MELTPKPATDDGTPDKKDLVWDPAPAKVNARLGPYTSAIADYLRHPPPGYPVHGIADQTELATERRKALEALIDLAFRP